MRLSVERLRWALIAGATLLVLALAGWIGLGRYRAVRNWQKLLQRTGASVTHDTNGFTYSQSLQGKTIFTVHAAKAVQHGDGQWGLRDAVLTLYGRVPGRADRIYGSEFEYDEKQGVARAIGEVHMDLQAPAALASAGRATPHGLEDTEPAQAGTAGKGEPADMIHVRTSGLVYMRKLDVAATDQEVDFQFHGVQGQSRGAEFNAGQSVLHLLADVHLQGLAHGRPMDVRAAKADLDRNTNVMNLSAPVVHSGVRTATGENAVLRLRKDGSLEHAHATGNVLLQSGTQSIGGSQFDADFNAQAQPQRATLVGDVKLADSSSTRPARGSARQVEMAFDGQGLATMVVGSAASLQMSVRGPGGQVLQRSLSGDQVTARLVRDGGARQSRLSELDVTGKARASGEALAKLQNANAQGPAPAQKKMTSAAADSLVANFGVDTTGRAVLQKLSGSGHTLLEQSAPGGAQQSSSGDTLQMVFAPESRGADQGAKGGSANVAISNAVQTGHVVVHSRAAQIAGKAAPEPVTATANSATYTAETDRVDLNGGAHYEQGGMSLSAARMTMETQTADATADGELVATIQSAGKPGASQPATHILADRARLVHATQIAEFYGTDAHPAKMWEGPSQVQAADILLDGVRKTLSARPAAAGGLVHAVFAETSQAEKARPNSATAGRPGASKAASGPGSTFVRVASPAMDYSDLQRNAIFSGGVHVEGTLGQARSDRAVVILNAPAKETQGGTAGGAVAGKQSPSLGTTGLFGGSLERFVLLGGVTLDQPGRKATGEQLTYSAATGNYVLTGTPGQPPHVVDSEQGSVTGATLLFGGQGSTIIVAGQQGTPKGAPDRVRTEILVRHP